MSELLMVAPGRTGENNALYERAIMRSSARTKGRIRETAAGLADEIDISESVQGSEPRHTSTQTARLARVRELIGRGEYLTFDKLEIAVERLHREIAGK